MIGVYYSTVKTASHMRIYGLALGLHLFMHSL